MSAANERDALPTPMTIANMNGTMSFFMTDSAHPEDSPTNAYFPQVIFIDSMWLDMSNWERSGMRWPDMKAISVPLKSLSLYASTIALDPTMTLWISLFQSLPLRFFRDAYSLGPSTLTCGSSASYLVSSNTSIQQFLSTSCSSMSAASTDNAPIAINPHAMNNLNNMVSSFGIKM